MKRLLLRLPIIGKLFHAPRVFHCLKCGVEITPEIGYWANGATFCEKCYPAYMRAKVASWNRLRPTVTPHP